MDESPIFDGAQERALARVLDEIVPPRPDGRLPGAGALGLAASVARVAEATPGLVPLLAAGLAALDELAAGRGAPDFGALAPAERRAALDELAATQPAFLGTLAFHTYRAYYHDPRVLEALGLEPRPPFPKGHAMEPFDPALLEPVRRLGRRYREVRARR